MDKDLMITISVEKYGELLEAKNPEGYYAEYCSKCVQL